MRFKKTRKRKDALLTLRIHPEEREQLSQLAIEADLTVADYIRRAIESYSDRGSTNEKPT